jgi:DNA-binding GntR family transcriptional regulator
MAAVSPTGEPGAGALTGLEIKRASTAEQAADVVRGMILQGTLVPGTPLPEVPMATSIGISRNTMREAIRVLAREGLVTHSMHRGAMVARLTERDVADLFRVRRALELKAVEESAGVSPEQLDGLDEAVQELARAADSKDWERIVEADRLFHERLVGFLGSSRLDRFFGTVQAELRLCLSILDREGDDPADLLAEHRELHELMARGRQALCAARLTKHLLDAERQLREIVRPWDEADGRS